jgi:hypothetical protein
MMRSSAPHESWGEAPPGVSPFARSAGSLSPARSAGRRAWASTAWLVAGTIAVAVTSYSLSLQVAAERRAVERLARTNAALSSDLKALDAELRVRMRMPQLQRWNDSVLGLVPISATQYLGEPVQLAAYGTAPETAAPRPAVQLAVRDQAPAPPQLPRALLASAVPANPQAAPVRAASAPAAAAPAPALQRPAAEPPADLLQQVELSFGTPDAPNR